MAIPTDVKSDACFKMKIKVSIQDSNTGRILVDPVDFETIVKPGARKYTNHTALTLRCESLALQEYSKKLWRDIETNTALAEKLENKEWQINAKTMGRIRETTVQPVTT
jgi:hypothetical protein